MAKGPTVLQLMYGTVLYLYTDLLCEFQFPAECHIPRGVPLVFLWEEEVEESGTLYHQLLQGRL